MGDFTQKMGLATWDQPLDRYDKDQLSNNWQIVDFHDHSPGRGVQIPRGGIAPGAVGPTQLGSDIPWVPVSGTLATRPVPSAVGRMYYATDNQQWYIDTGSAWQVTHANNGSTHITATESTAATTYQLLPTPDQVQNITLANNGLIAVWYQASWSASVSSGGTAAIFLGSNQLQVIASNSATAPSPQSVTSPGASNILAPLGTTPLGLSSGVQTSNYTGDVTTGQIVGPGAGIEQAGPCYIFAAAGTYTVSVQFKASSGAVNASNRRLWVRALDFSG